MMMRISFLSFYAGAERHPVLVSGRVVLGFWWLFTILTISLYTASLAAQLAVPTQAQSIDSIQDLAASSLQPVVQSATSWWDLFKVSTEETTLLLICLILKPSCTPRTVPLICQSSLHARWLLIGLMCMW
jgi:hypothetical protein